MSDASKNIEKVQQIVNTYVEESRQDSVAALLEAIGDQYFTAPASTRKDVGYAYPGGLCDLSLRVCYWAHKLNETMESKIPTSSVMLVGLLHQLGKVGMPGKDLYIPQDSQWHKDRGMMYTVEESLKGMTVRDRTMFLLQKYKVELADYEYQALMLWEGQYSTENQPMRYKENPLALLIHWAYIWIATQEKK